MEVGRGASTRVPGMLEVRAKFAAALPKEEGAAAADDEEAAAGAGEDVERRCTKCDGRHMAAHCPHFPDDREDDAGEGGAD